MGLARVVQRLPDKSLAINDLIIPLNGTVSTFELTNSGGYLERNPKKIIPVCHFVGGSQIHAIRSINSQTITYNIIIIIWLAP